MAFSVRWRKMIKNTSTCFTSVKTDSLLVTIEKDGWQKGCFLIIFLVTWCPQTDIPSHCLLFSSLLQKYRKLSTGYQHHHLRLTGRNLKKKMPNHTTAKPEKCTEKFISKKFTTKATTGRRIFSFKMFLIKRNDKLIWRPWLRWFHWVCNLRGR